MEEEIVLKICNLFTTPKKSEEIFGQLLNLITSTQKLTNILFQNSHLLYNAIKNHKFEIALELIKYGCNFDDTCIKDMKPCLRLAIQKNLPQKIEFLRLTRLNHSDRESFEKYI